MAEGILRLNNEYVSHPQEVLNVEVHLRDLDKLPTNVISDDPIQLLSNK